MVNDNLENTAKPVVMLGELVHNEQVTKKFTQKGVRIVNNVDDIKTGTIIITAHGINPAIKEKIKEKGNMSIVDTTCPKVLAVHKLAKLLRMQDKEILIFGDSEHKEVQGISGAAGSRAVIFCTKQELENINFSDKKSYGLMAQTTRNLEQFRGVVKYLKSRVKNLKTFNTICEATQIRQKEARQLAKENDTMLVVGSQASSNTTRLFEICSTINKKTYFINHPTELKKQWFVDIEKVGIIGGASTPDWIIGQIVARLKNTVFRVLNKKAGNALT